MSLLRNSVIVGGATFLVGSAFMEIGKSDSKSDIGKWPYVATFLSGALGFYLLKQNFIPVPKALELNAETLDREETWKNRDNMSYFFVMEKDGRGIYGQNPYRTKEDAIQAGEKPDEIYEYRGLNSLSKEEREAQKKDNHEWYDREKQGEFFEDFWWKDEMSRYGNSDYERLHHSLYDSSTENDEKDGHYAKTILPSNPSGFEQETNQAYAQQLGISERLGALLNSSRSFGMYLSQRENPDTVKKYRQKILDGFDSYKPQSEKEKKIVEIVRENMATRGVKGPSPSYWGMSRGMLRKPELNYVYDDYYDNPIPFMGYELTDEEKKIIGGGAESFSADGDEDLDIHSGSYHGRKKSKYDGVSYISPQFDKTDQLKCKCGFRKEFHYPYSCYSCGPEAHHGKGKIVGFTTNGRIIWRDLCTGKYMVDTDGKTDIDLFNSIHQCKEAESFSAENESSSSLQSFAAEVFEADRKIRRRTRWTWTRGSEKGFEIEDDDLSELPYDIDYTAYTGRGYYRQTQPMYSIEDAYYISDLPEGYYLHLYKPSVRSGEWRAFSKSPNSEDWNEYTNSKKSNLTGDLLNWYNQDIAQPEEKTLSPIEKLMISKGMKSGTVQIERVVIPKTKYTPEKVQYFALGGPTNMSPTNICEIESGLIALENLTYANDSNLFAFGQGLKFMTEKAGTLRSVNRFNKNPEAWVKSYPAWFQNAVENKLTDIDVDYMLYDYYDGGIKINGTKVLKFLNGVDSRSWRPINESERKMIDTPYGEMPQFEIYELDMMSPAPIRPRPSTMRKIYAKSFKQNLNGEWKFNKDMFMMAVVDKYKFENGGSEVIHNSMVNEPLYSIDIIPYMTPMAELMARRYKKKE